MDNKPRRQRYMTHGEREPLVDSARPGNKNILLDRFPDWAVLIVFCLVFSAQVILSVGQQAATYDEPANLASGYFALRTRDYRIMPQNLPLLKLLAAAPLVFLKINVPSVNATIDEWHFGSRFLYISNAAYGDKLLMLGRLAVLPVALLLGGFVFLWAKQLFGKGAAFFALFFFAFEPNFLAHSGLITTDLALACFMFLAVYGLHQIAHRLSVSHLLLLSFAWGLGALTKFTSLVFLLAMVMLGILVCRSPEPMTIQIAGVSTSRVEERGRKAIILLLVLIVLGVVTYALIWTTYRFQYQGVLTPGLTYQMTWGDIMPKGFFLKQIFTWVRETKFLPEPYLYGFLFHLKRSGEFNSFLLGTVRPGGWWYYFFVTFFFKTPVAFLILIILALSLRTKWRAGNKLSFSFLLLPVAVYFGIISISGWNIGHRHLLPIYPFLFVLTGGFVSWAIKQKAGAKIAVGGLVAWYLFSSLSMFPHYLAYFNELAGGPENGYKYLVDSNLDWGQDLKGLKRYMDENGIPKLWLSYFGTADPDYYGIDYNYLPSYGIYNPRNIPSDLSRVDKLPLLRGTVAISATNLQELYLQPHGWTRDYFELYRNQTPVAKIGYSIFIYRFD